MPAADRRPGAALVLRLRFDEALPHHRDEADQRRLCRLGVLFGRYRVVAALRRFLSDDAYRQFLRERALPQVPIGGAVASGFAVDEAMIAAIAGDLGEPVPALLGATARRMIAAGSRHIAKLYVLARLAGDAELVRSLQPAFDAPAADPRRDLPARVCSRWPVAILQAGDDDDYNPKSASLFMGDHVVLKEMLRLHLDPAHPGGYSEERELLASIQHPRIVRQLDHVTVGRHELLLLERSRGRALDGSALPGAEARRVIGQLAEVLAWLHAAGVLYLDVKPQNILYDGANITLVDFGMARRGACVTSMLSTLEYVPPEMARDFTSTPAADVFQLGIVAYQLLVGRHPFSAGSGVDVALANLWDEPELTAPALAELRPVIAQMLAKQPGDRPTAADVHAALCAA